MYVSEMLFDVYRVWFELAAAYVKYVILLFGCLWILFDWGSYMLLARLTAMRPCCFVVVPPFCAAHLQDSGSIVVPLRTVFEESLGF